MNKRSLLVTAVVLFFAIFIFANVSVVKADYEYKVTCLWKSFWTEELGWQEESVACWDSYGKKVDLPAYQSYNTEFVSYEMNGALVHEFYMYWTYVMPGDEPGGPASSPAASSVPQAEVPAGIQSWVRENANNIGRSLVAGGFTWTIEDTTIARYEFKADGTISTNRWLKESLIGGVLNKIG